MSTPTATPSKAAGPGGDRHQFQDNSLIDNPYSQMTDQPARHTSIPRPTNAVHYYEAASGLSSGGAATPNSQSQSQGQALQLIDQSAGLSLVPPNDVAHDTQQVGAQFLDFNNGSTPVTEQEFTSWLLHAGVPEEDTYLMLQRWLANQIQPFALFAAPEEPATYKYQEFSEQQGPLSSMSEHADCGVSYVEADMDCAEGEASLQSQ